MVTIKELYKDDKQGSVAEVTIGEEVVEVRFWGSIVKAIGEGQELEAYIKYFAHKQLGNDVEAKNTIQPFAKGYNTIQTSEVEVDGRIYFTSTGQDDRNIFQQMIDND